jgi:hypothetical protein
MNPKAELQLNSRYLDVMLLHKEGYCCSQIMAILALRRQDQDNPDLVRAMRGLCHGIIYNHETCGVLLAGDCLISLYAGRGSDEELEHKRLPLMLIEMAEWFKSRTGGTFEGMKCEEILARRPDQHICLDLITEADEKVMSILRSHDVSAAGGGYG